jgi:hypothetical protein
MVPNWPDMLKSTGIVSVRKPGPVSPATPTTPDPNISELRLRAKLAECRLADLEENLADIRPRRHGAAA